MMNAAEAEALIRQHLDGWFFTLAHTRGEESELRVFAKKVAKDYIYDYEAVEDLTEAAQKAAKLAGEKKHRPWTEEETEKLVTLRQTGLRWDFIAREIRRCNRSVKERYAAIASERGLPPPVNTTMGRFSRLTEDQKYEIVKRRDAGQSFGEIAKALGLSDYVPRDYYHRFKRYLKEKRNQMVMA